MNYEKFRFRAAVDWIEVAIQTATPTNFHAIRRHGDFDFVEPLDAGGGGAATRFSFRIQNPASWDAVVQTLSDLAQFHPFAAIPIVVAIEIALDAYGKGTTEAGLVNMAADFYRRSSRHVSDNQRLYRDYKGSPTYIPEHIESLERSLADGYQIGIGDKTDDRYQHIYYKTYDNRINLGPDEYRARTEVTLRAKALPCLTVDDWAVFKFEGLQKPTGENLFRFRKLKPDLNPLSQQIAGRKRLGVRQRRWRALNDGSGYGGSRQYPKGTMADAALNERARNALRELSRRWRTNQSLINGQVTCGNPGELEAALLSTLGNPGGDSDNYVLIDSSNNQVEIKQCNDRK